MQIALAPRLSADNEEALAEAMHTWNVALGGCAEFVVSGQGIPIAEPELPDGKVGEWGNGVIWIAPRSHNEARRILTHEMGHMLGIDGHLEDPECMMHRYGSDSLCPEDVALAREVLGC